MWWVSRFRGEAVATRAKVRAEMMVAENLIVDKREERRERESVCVCDLC